MVASVPEQAIRTISTAGHISTIISATSSSSSPVMAKRTPFFTSSITFWSTAS